MKKMRKIFAMLLALTMVLGMATTVFAAQDSATVTVNNAGNAKFQYLQVIKEDRTTRTGWAFANAQIAANYKEAFSLQDEQAIIEAMIGANGDTDSKIAAALAKVAAAGYTLSTPAVASPFTVNAAGVYYVKGEETGYVFSPMAAYVGFEKYDVDADNPELKDTTVEAKKTSSSIEKTNDIASGVTEIGRTVTYTIKSTVPYLPLTDTDRHYEVIDEITGASYVTEETGDNAGKVKVTATVGNNTFTFYGEVTGNSFKVDLAELIENNTYANAAFELSYQATVTDTVVGNEAFAGNGKNEGKDIYGSSSSNLITGSITITKYASDNDNENLSDNEKLNGAKFVIYKTTGEGESAKTEYATFANGKFVAWVASQEQATEIETTGEGAVTVSGLDLGIYSFKETKAPEGYSVNTDVKTVEIKKEGTVAAGSNYMIDTQVSSLPSTGGIGTTIFTIGGCIIMIVAAGLFFATRRKAVK